ncbi:16S rRNA (adenine(1518)-N(6)/adenine(1519)-N(6))-dimethyltransferase RsmA [Pseudactinotalea sp. HY158]|uniref:16S rRNA (adenine(1518)-N(6)/adenine(1519)-N(6))- dimethyltransferase RsmA n=1 Tax=Pseudactinotalea sp. HY158 TaxID=2654547 RepID=UPI00129CB904|nr:16S rRNA (adenine(1518)-N(6)/adenine(1519)-N(6))-dimethyltransferase RsmA [Pseudactinotalea sp. HY158]QGH68650.1 16S rRNA (adenine(1518)-N(6)/adenine(1519)-N(6))-dimethyltransferase RsmA [Pseudactinotalea sp. HY158]
MTVHLLSASDIRGLAEEYGIRPSKVFGQNFVVDPGTVRRIVRTAGVEPGDVVMEVGPGLGSLTLGLLEAGAHVVAVEIDTELAPVLPRTVTRFAPGTADRLTVVTADAMKVTELPITDGGPPTRLVANLPYNVAVPVILHCLAAFPTLTEALVMVQAEVADRLVAAPGSRIYGVPSAKAAWYSEATRAGSIGRAVFWPVPRVDSSLVRMVRREPPGATATRAGTFAVIDAAFAQRRKTLRSALAGWAGSAALAESALRAAGIDPALRGERLRVEDFAAIAAHAPEGAAGPDRGTRNE